MILASKIALELGMELVGKDISIDGFSFPKDFKKNHVYWSSSEDLFLKINNGVLIAPQKFKKQKNKDMTYLFTNKSPRLEFAKFVNIFFPKSLTERLKNEVLIHKKNKSIHISDNCFIGENVEIGEGTTIYPNTTIFEGTKIGKNCIIKSNCSIATEGLGYEYEGEKMYKFPQIGGVIIEDNVEFGPNSTIRKGALGNTIIKKFSKIGALSNIGHNCLIGEKTILTCQIVTGGSSVIGNNAFIGINATITNGVIIGENAIVGMSAVVTKNIPSNETWIGIPAKKMVK